MKKYSASFSALFLMWTVTIQSQITPQDLESFSNIKQELPRLKKSIPSKRGEILGQKALLDMFLFNIAGRLSNLESSSFPVDAQELMPLNLSAVKQIEMDITSTLLNNEIATYTCTYRFDSEGCVTSLHSDAFAFNFVFTYREGMLYAVEKPTQTAYFYIGSDYVLLDASSTSSEDTNLNSTFYWGFDTNNNINRRRINQDQYPDQENQYASIYDTQTHTLNAFNRYTGYSVIGHSSSKKFTNNKQIPFDVIDGYEYPESATACFRVVQKDNIISIFQLQYEVKIKEYRFSLNEKKNIEKIVVLAYEKMENEDYQVTEEKQYILKYTYW